MYFFSVIASYNAHVRKILLWVPTIFLVWSCVDPYEPVYDFEKSILFIQGEVSGEPGRSSVHIQESKELLGSYITENVSNAYVEVRTSSNLTEVFESTADTLGIYLPGTSFVAESEKEYQLYVRLEDGREYRSTWQSQPAPVEMDKVTATFDPEVRFSEIRGELVPGHQIRVDWQDPPGQSNYYRWTYTIIREESICQSCFGGRYRDGACQADPSLPISNRYDYLCSELCFSFETKSNLVVQSDEFINGNRVRDKEVGILEFESRKPVLIEVSQYTISQEQFAFSRLANELGVESGGVNATLPGALIGNVFNVNEPNERVIGFFGASSRTTDRVFINRNDIMAIPLGEGLSPILEPPAVMEDIPQAPCESPNRSTAKPEGWP